MSIQFTVSPSSLSFLPAIARGAVDLYSDTGDSKTFVFTNLSGSSITFIGAGFADGLANDAVTQPAGLGRNSDFTVVPASGSFPVTVTNGSTQSFTVTYIPLRNSSSFDVRSAIVSLINTSGINVLVPVGGGVINSGFNNPTTHPMMGLPSIFSIADLDTADHYDPIYLLGTPHSVASALVTGVPDPLQPTIVAAAGVTSATGSFTYVPVGARSVQVLVTFGDITQGCDLKIYANSGANTLVGSWTGLTYKNVGKLFIGNATGIDLQGFPLAAKVSNLTNSVGIWVAVNVMS